MSFLIDTNVLSELRKGERAHQGVVDWFKGVEDHQIHLSVLVLGEIRKGIESIRRRDPKRAVVLDGWLRELYRDHGQRVIGIDEMVAEVWGQLNVPDPLPTIDSLIAATAHVHGLTVVTRNVEDIARTGVPVLNPFDASIDG